VSILQDLVECVMKRSISPHAELLSKVHYGRSQVYFAQHRPLKVLVESEERWERRAEDGWGGGGDRCLQAGACLRPQSQLFPARLCNG